MAQGDVVQVVLHGTLQGQVINNVLHFTEGAGGATLQDLMTDVRTRWTTNILNLMSATLTMDKLTARNITQSGDVEDQAWTGTKNGATPGDALPSFNAALISIFTGGGGRHGRGRIFLAGLPENGTSAGKLDLSIFSGLETFCTNFLADFKQGEPTFQGYGFGVYSRPKDLTGPINYPGGFRAATKLTPRDVIAVMRRRKIGKGV